MKKIINKLPVIITMVLLSSCLKEAPMNIDTGLSNNVIEFANTGTNQSPSGAVYPRFFNDLGVLEAGDTASFLVNISYSGPEESASQDITVNLEADTAAVTAYNNDQAESYIFPPSSVYSFPSSVVIAKGTHRAQFRVTITVSDEYDFTASYALPLKITTVAPEVPVSSNFGTAVYNFGARNIYDGSYDINGYILREGDNVLSGYYSGYSVDLITAGPYSVQYDHHPWADGSSVGGIDGLTLTVDPATNKVNVSCVTNPAVTNAADYDNRYDPDTKTFYVSYYWGSGPTNRAATDTLVYSAAR